MNRFPVPLPECRPLVVAIVLAMPLGFVTCPAEDKAAEASPAPAFDLMDARQRTDWHAVLRSEVSFTPPAPMPPAAPAATAGMRDPDAAENVVPIPMPQYIVPGKSFSAYNLGYDIRAEEKAGREEAKVSAVSKKLGIGAHTIGTKHFQTGFITVFYIPVFVFAGWSW